MDTQKELTTAVDTIVNCMHEFTSCVLRALTQCCDCVHKLVERYTNCVVPGRLVYLAQHSKSWRVRKKNQKRIQKIIKEELWR